LISFSGGRHIWYELISGAAIGVNAPEGDVLMMTDSGQGK